MFELKEGKLFLNIRNLLIFLLFFFYFQPEYIKSIHVFDRIYSYIFALIFLGIFFFYFAKKKTPSLYVWLFFLYNSWLFFLTTKNHGNVRGALFQFIVFTGFTALLDLFSENINALVGALMLNFELNIYINFLTLIFFPAGFFHRLNEAYGYTVEWFLGANNNFLFMMFPATVIALLYKNLGGSKLRSYSLIGVILASQFIRGSGTAQVGIVGLLLFELLPISKYILTPYKGLILSVITSFLIVIARNVEFLRVFIERVLQKDLTFTSRTTIWNNAIQAVQAKPSGHGMMDLSSVVYILGSFPGWIWKGATHAHNNFLQVLFQSGHAGFVVYLLIIVTGSYLCYKYWKKQNARLFFYALFIFTIISITENLETQLMYLVLCLPFLLPQVVAQEEARYEK